jgi:membrane associated rhomboid family serine protease
MTYGFFIGNWTGLISYSFLHIGLAHLIGNIAILLVVGIIAERKLHLRDFFAIYILSGAVAAFLFAAMNPNTVLIGASAAISGLLCCAFFINFKKAIIVVPITILIMSLLVVPVISSYVESAMAALDEQGNILEEDLNQTLVQKNATKAVIAGIQSNISTTTDKFERGEINETEYNALISSLTNSLSNKTSELQNIEDKENKTAQELLNTLGQKQNIDQGREREEEVKSPIIVHLAGFFTAFAYIMVFRRDILWGLPDSMPFIKRAQTKKTKKKHK